MSSLSDRRSGRSSSYEKMLVADTFLIIGCILLSFGAGLSFYYIPVTAQDVVAPLAPDNSYSRNFTIHLDQGDALLLGAKPYALANISLVLGNADFKTILVFVSSEPGSFLNFSYTASIAGDYKIVVLENLTVPSNRPVYCEVEVMSVQVLGSPFRPYVIYGVVLVLVGFVSLLYSGRSRVRTPELDEWYDRKDYFLPILLFASTIGFASLFSLYAVLGSNQLGVIGDILLVAFPALNVYSLLVGIITLQGEPLLIFLRTLLLSIVTWISSFSLLVYLLPSILLGYSYTWDLNVFLRSMEGLATMSTVFLEVETLLVIIVLAYCLSYRYGRHRIYSYQLETEVVEAGTVGGLMKKLESSLGKKDLEDFFRKLRDRDLEASAFLYFILSDRVNSGISSFTYHSIISDRREIFSKDIYERDPAQKILQPLGYLKVSGKGRFKTYQLQVDKPIVNRLIALFKNIATTTEKDNLAKWAGVYLLKQRRMRYSGLLKEDGQTESN
jgi:hypothetical protein